MDVYINDELRELHVYDRFTGQDYAKNVVCAQDRLETGPLGEFSLSEKEYAYWQDVLATIQASEDMRYAMKDRVNLKEVDDYIFEDAQYLTDIRSTAETEYYCLKEVEKALKDEDRDWFAAHGFVKTLKGELDDKSEE